MIKESQLTLEITTQARQQSSANKKKTSQIVHCHHNSNLNCLYSTLNETKLFRQIKVPYYITMTHFSQQMFLTTEGIELYSTDGALPSIKLNIFCALTQTRIKEKMESLSRMIESCTHSECDGSKQLKIGFLYADPINNQNPVSYYDQITKVIREIAKEKKNVMIVSLPATEENLKKLIQAYKVDMLHISCHGKPDQLRWENHQDNTEVKIKVKSFYMLLNSLLGTRKLMSLIIMACQSSRFIGLGLDRTQQFKGQQIKMKSSLLVAFDQGFEIENKAAQIFSAAFYSNFISRWDPFDIISTKSRLQSSGSHCLKNVECFEKALKKLTECYYYCPCSPANVSQLYVDQYCREAKSKDRKCNNKCKSKPLQNIDYAELQGVFDSLSNAKHKNMYRLRIPQNFIHKNYQKIIFNSFSKQLREDVCRQLNIPIESCSQYYFRCCCSSTEYRAPRIQHQQPDFFRRVINSQEDIPILKHREVKKQNADEQEYIRVLDQIRPFFRDADDFSRLCNQLSPLMIRFVVGDFDTGKTTLVIKTLMYLQKRRYKMFDDIIYLDMGVDKEESIDSLIEFRASCNYKRDGKYHYLNHLQKAPDNYFVVFDSCSELIDQNPQGFEEFYKQMQNKLSNKRNIYIAETPLSWDAQESKNLQFKKQHKHIHKLYDQNKSSSKVSPGFEQYVRQETPIFKRDGLKQTIAMYAKKGLTYCDFMIPNLESDDIAWIKKTLNEIYTEYEKSAQATVQDLEALVLMKVMKDGNVKENENKIKIHMKKIQIARRAIYDDSRVNCSKLQSSVTRIISELESMVVVSSSYVPSKPFQVHYFNQKLQRQQIECTIEGLLSKMQVLAKLIPCIRGSKFWIIQPGGQELCQLAQRLYCVLTNIPKAALFLSTTKSNHDNVHTLVKKAIGKAIACLQLYHYGGAHTTHYYSGLGILSVAMINSVKSIYTYKQEFDIHRVSDHLMHMCKVFTDELGKTKQSRHIQLSLRMLKLQSMYYRLILTKAPETMDPSTKFKTAKELLSTLHQFCGLLPESHHATIQLTHLYCSLCIVGIIVTLNPQIQIVQSLKSYLQSSKRKEEQAGEAHSQLLKIVREKRQSVNRWLRSGETTHILQEQRRSTQLIKLKEIIKGQLIQFRLLVGLPSKVSIQKILLDELSQAIDCKVEHLNKMTLKNAQLQYQDILSIFIDIKSMDRLNNLIFPIYTKTEGSVRKQELLLSSFSTHSFYLTKILLVFIRGCTPHPNVAQIFIKQYQKSPEIVTIFLSSNSLRQDVLQMLLFLKLFLEITSKKMQYSVLAAALSCQKILRIILQQSILSCITHSNQQVRIPFSRPIRLREYAEIEKLLDLDDQEEVGEVRNTQEITHQVEMAGNSVFGPDSQFIEEQINFYSRSSVKENISKVILQQLPNISDQQNNQESQTPENNEILTRVGSTDPIYPNPIDIIQTQMNHDVPKEQQSEKYPNQEQPEKSLDSCQSAQQISSNSRLFLCSSGLTIHPNENVPAISTAEQRTQTILVEEPSQVFQNQDKIIISHGSQITAQQQQKFASLNNSSCLKGSRFLRSNKPDIVGLYQSQLEKKLRIRHTIPEKLQNLKKNPSKKH